MRLRGSTDSADWHPLTLWAMLTDPSTWDGGVTWREWKLDALYAWYDGPIFQLRVGPFWIALTYFQPH